MTMHITAVENYKGGVGKTTTAVNLAYELAHAGFRVLLVDMDPQQNAAYLMRAKPRRVNLEQALSMHADVRKAIQRYPFSHNLYLLAGADGMDNLDLNHIDLRFTLQECGDDYDYCIIDCNPGMTMLTVNALVAADDVLIPVEPDVFGAVGLEKIMDYINQAKEYNENIRVLGCVATKFNGRASQLRMIRQIMEDDRIPVFDTCITYAEAVNTALERRKPVSRHRSRSTVSADYESLAREYVGRVKYVTQE